MATQIKSDLKYTRLPKAGERCPISGFSRSYFYKLEKLGQIKLLHVRQPGARSGITMVAQEEIHAFLEKHRSSQEVGA